MQRLQLEKAAPSSRGSARLASATATPSELRLADRPRSSPAPPALQERREVRGHPPAPRPQRTVGGPRRRRSRAPARTAGSPTEDREHSAEASLDLRGVGARRPRRSCCSSSRRFGPGAAAPAERCGARLRRAAKSRHRAVSCRDQCERRPPRRGTTSVRRPPAKKKRAAEARDAAAGSPLARCARAPPRPRIRSDRPALRGERPLAASSRSRGRASAWKRVPPPSAGRRFLGLGYADEFPARAEQSDCLRQRETITLAGPMSLRARAPSNSIAAPHPARRRRAPPEPPRGCAPARGHGRAPGRPAGLPGLWAAAGAFPGVKDFLRPGSAASASRPRNLAGRSRNAGAGVAGAGHDHAHPPDRNRNGRRALSSGRRALPAGAERAAETRSDSSRSISD